MGLTAMCAAVMTLASVARASNPTVDYKARFSGQFYAHGTKCRVSGSVFNYDGRLYVDLGYADAMGHTIAIHTLDSMEIRSDYARFEASIKWNGKNADFVMELWKTNTGNAVKVQVIDPVTGNKWFTCKGEGILLSLTP
jgi:hypothetical protein